MKRVIFMSVIFGIAVVASASELSVSDKGFGPISSHTRFDQKEILSLLTGYVVKPGKSSTEGEEFPVLTVADAKSVLATISPADDQTQIFSIRIANNKVHNELGPAIGAKYGNIYGNVVHASCSAGMEEMSGAVICQDPHSKHVSYIFRGNSDEADGSIPTISTLKNFVINEIVWLP